MTRKASGQPGIGRRVIRMPTSGGTNGALCMPLYRLHDTDGNGLGLFRHPAPNLEPGDVLVLRDGREALVTGRVESSPNRALTALLLVFVSPVSSI